MGCHTWCYDRVFELSCVFPDEVISETIGNIYYKNKVYGEEVRDKEYAKVHLEVAKYFKRLKTFWDKGWFREGTAKQRLLDKLADEVLYPMPYRYQAGVAWKSVEGFGNNLFRVGGYPEDIMLSYEDTIKFLDKYYDPKNIYRGGERNDKLIKEFWEKYPNGMIYVG